VRRTPLDVEGDMSTTLRMLVLGLIIAATSVAAAKESVAIQVSPAVSFAPSDLVIRTNVEPDASNRVMEIIADSEGFYRSSAIQLEGDRAPRTTTVWFHSLPSGEYEVIAVVIGADGQQKALARAHVNILNPH
jgi:hypothetical protein